MGILSLRKMNNGQLADELLHYMNDNVDETPQNVKKFRDLMTEIVRRLKDPAAADGNRKRIPRRSGRYDDDPRRT